MQFALRLTNRFATFNPETTKTFIRRYEKRTHRAETLLRVFNRQRSLETRVIEHRAEPMQLEPVPQPVTPERVKQQRMFPRTPMTVAKPHAAVSATKSAVSGGESQTEIIRRPSREIEPAHNNAAQTPLTLPLQELSRVTDHVIKQLDRRVLSYRERTGRT